MIHPWTELRFISPEVGYGVVATEYIPKGTITWALDRLDREFSLTQLKAFDTPYREIIEKYSYRNNKGRYVLCWDIGRFVNHSFRSNCLSTAYDFELAIRDIKAGEELTDDYGYLNVTEPFRGIDEGTKRKFVYPNDLPKYHKIWDKKIASAFSLIKGVDQPLSPFLSQSTWRKCSRILETKIELDSILENYFQDKTPSPISPRRPKRVKVDVETSLDSEYTTA